MATIVTNTQQHAPWWSNLAVNVLGGLWNDYQQREANKKANAYYGELMKQLQTLGNEGKESGGFSAATPLQGTGQGLLNTPEQEGYNSNGWANALHKTINPLTQFDLGTNGLLDTNTTQTQGTSRLPNALDIYKAAMGLAATKRFAMMNPETVQNMITPYMKMNEEARAEQMRRDAANAYTNAGNDTDRLNQLYASTILGVTPQAILNSGQERYRYDNPYMQPYTQNTGAETIYGGFNPKTGQYTESGRYQNTITPQQAIDNAYRNATLAENSRQYDTTLAYNREGRAWEQGHKDRMLDMQGREKVTSHPYVDADGVAWLIYDSGRREKISEAQGFSEQQKAKLQANTSESNNLTKIRERLGTTYGQLIQKGYDTNDDEVKSIIAQINEVDNRMKAINAENERIFSSRNTGSNNTSSNNTSQIGEGLDIGANMLGVRKATITTNFNALRKKEDGTPYNHHGTDYAIAKDTPIRLDDVGTAMKVTKIANDPDGYGNYVDLKGVMTDADGKQHKIGMRFAHMGDGTVNVTEGQVLKFGDLIGKVGNTGNSRGRNGGYHLHLETTIDGKRVDPTKFKELISPYIAHTKTLQPNTIIGISPLSIRKATVEGRRKETTPAQTSSSGNEVIYRNKNTGKVIKRSDWEKMNREADEGKIPEVGSSKALDSWLTGQGFEYAGGNARQDTTAQPQPVSSSSSDKFPTMEQPTAQVTPLADPFDERPSYTRVTLPPAKGYARLNPTTSVSFVPPVNLLGTNDSTLGQTTLVSPSTEEEAGVQDAIAQLNNQYNTWDDIYRNRYKFGSQSDFWRA